MEKQPQTESAKYNLSSYLFALLCSLIVAVAISSISRIPSRFVFSVIFAAITFLICCLILPDVNLNFRPKGFGPVSKFNFNALKEFFVPTVYVTFLILVVVIPPANTMQFTDWLQIPVASYVRLLAGLLLSSILPGYGLLRLIDKRKKFVGVDSLVFSFFISVFLMSLTAYALMVLNIPIAYNYWTTLILNIVIFVLFSYTTVKKRKNEESYEEHEKSSSWKLDCLILGCVFAFFVAGWVVLYSSYNLGSPGDMWDHYGSFMQIMKGVNLSSPSHLAYLGSESWFVLHYVSVAQLGGFPTVNGWMVYAFINFFYILAFYQMVRGIIGKKYPKIPAVATVVGILFAGFGWVKAMSLSSDSGGTWAQILSSAGHLTYNDIIYVFLYGPIPQILSLAMMCSLLYLMTREKDFGFSSAFLTVTLVSTSYLVHMPEMVLFFVFYYCYLFFVGKEQMRHLKRFTFSILIGIFIVLILGIPFPSHFFYDQKLPLFVLLISTIMTFAPMYLKGRIHFSLAFLRNLSTLITALVWAFYGLSFLAWYATQNLDIAGNLVSIGLKPWYVWPVTQGISGLLLLLGATYLVTAQRAEIKNLKFLLSSLVSFLVVGKILSYVNINIMETGYWEKRFTTFTIIPISIIGAFFVIEAVRKFFSGVSPQQLRTYPAKSAIAALLIAVVVISGVSSMVLALDYNFSMAKGNPYAYISNGEMEALEYLRKNAPADSTVLGLSIRSNRIASVFSGMNHLNSPYWFTTNNGYQFIDVENPELALKILYSLNITYLYGTSKDLENINSNGFVANHLLKYLPIAFQNNKVTIYRIPKLHPPSSDSNFTIVFPDYVFNAISDPSVLTQNLPSQMLFNETFAQYEEGSDGTPAWNPISGTWNVENGTYEGAGQGWIIQPSVISNLTLSDFSVRARFKIGSGYYAGIVFRYADSSNFYWVVISQDGQYDDVYKTVGGRAYLIKHSTAQPARVDWNTLRVDGYGDQFYVYLNGELIVSTSDQEFASGKVGLLVNSATCCFDNVTVERPPDTKGYMDQAFYLPIDMMAQSTLEYSIRTSEDGAQYSSQYILLPSDQRWTQEKISGYLTWVEKGGNLIILNSNGFGDFAKTLSINSNPNKLVSVNQIVGESGEIRLEDVTAPSLFLSDSDVKVIANYVGQNNQSVPFVLAKRFGDGAIFYMNTNSLFEVLSSSNETQKYRGQNPSFPKLGNLVSFLNLNASHYKEIPSNDRWKYLGYNTTSIRDYARFQGHVQIESNSILIPYDQIEVGELKLINASGTINESSISETSVYEQIVVNNLVLHGTIPSVVTSEDTCIFPTNFGAYSSLLLESGFNISLQLSNNKADFVILDGNETYEVDLTSGTIAMENITTSKSRISDDFASLKIPGGMIADYTTLMFARTPSFSAKGTAFISEAYIPNYINYVYGYLVQINGTTHFDFDCSSETVSLLNNFGYSGLFQTEQEAAKPSMFYWEIGAIPWNDVLASPVFITFCIVLVMTTTVVYYMSKRRFAETSSKPANNQGESLKQTSLVVYKQTNLAVYKKKDENKNQ